MYNGGVVFAKIILAQLSERVLYIKYSFRVFCLLADFVIHCISLKLKQSFLYFLLLFPAKHNYDREIKALSKQKIITELD